VIPADRPEVIADPPGGGRWEELLHVHADDERFARVRRGVMHDGPAGLEAHARGMAGELAQEPVQDRLLKLFQVVLRGGDRRRPPLAWALRTRSTGPGPAESVRPSSPAGGPVRPGPPCRFRARLVFRSGRRSLPAPRWIGLPKFRRRKSKNPTSSTSRCGQKVRARPGGQGPRCLAFRCDLKTPALWLCITLRLTKHQPVLCIGAPPRQRGDCMRAPKGRSMPFQCNQSSMGGRRRR